MRVQACRARTAPYTVRSTEAVGTNRLTSARRRSRYPTAATSLSWSWSKLVTDVHGDGSRDGVDLVLLGREPVRRFPRRLWSAVAVFGRSEACWINAAGPDGSAPAAAASSSSSSKDSNNNHGPSLLSLLSPPGLGRESSDEAPRSATPQAPCTVPVQPSRYQASLFLRGR